MQIIRNEKGKYHIKPLSSHELENEMSIAKPKGQVKLTDRMAAYFLAAAGGTWTRSDLVSRFFIPLFITASGILDRVLATVKRSKRAL